MARAKDTLTGRGIIRYEPYRNVTLAKREDRVASDFHTWAVNQLDLSRFALKGEALQTATDALAAIKEAYKAEDVVETQLAARRLAKTLLNVKGPKEYRVTLEWMAKYRNQYHYWAVATVDAEIARYYRWWINRELLNITGVEGFGLKAPSHAPHITITRGVNDLLEVPREEREALWGKYEGEEVEFTYTPEVRYTGDTTGDRKATHWFVVVNAPKLMQIREEFDIPTNWRLHLTVGKDYLA